MEIERAIFGRDTAIYAISFHRLLTRYFLIFNVDIISPDSPPDHSATDRKCSIPRFFKKERCQLRYIHTLLFQKK